MANGATKCIESEPKPEKDRSRTLKGIALDRYTLTHIHGNPFSFLFDNVHGARTHILTQGADTRPCWIAILVSPLLTLAVLRL